MNLTFDYWEEVKRLREEKKFLTNKINKLETENEQLRKKLNAYDWSETNKINNSWKAIHEMGM